MLDPRETIDTRLQAHRDIGTYDREGISPSEDAGVRVALEGVQAARAYKLEVARNGTIIANFVDTLAPKPLEQFNRIGVPLDDLERVKQLQSSLVWGAVGTPYFVVGARQTKNPNISSILITHYPFQWERRGRLERIDVNTKDLEVAESFMDATLHHEYSSDDIQSLTDEAKGEFRLTYRHPRSSKLRIHDNTYNPFWFVLSRKILPPNFKRGVRGKTSKSVFHFKTLPVPELTDQTMADYDILDRLADLAVKFDKEEELRFLVSGEPAHKSARRRWPLPRLPKSVRFIVGSPK